MGVTFQPRSEFAPSAGAYRFLPFRFEPLDERRVVLTNLVGELLVLDRDSFEAFVDRGLPPEVGTYLDLKAKHFLIDDTSSVGLDLLTLKARTRAEPIAQFTGLHIFVVTLRCDHSCGYCQVSRQTTDKTAFDMTDAHAQRAVEFVFESPSPNLKVEFQGGEPLLNFDLIRRVVLAAEAKNVTEKRNLQFVIASNLSPITDEILAFCQAHEVYFSTSLDGPAELHNRNRPRPGRNSYELAVAGIERVRHALGFDRVSALMTTTPESLGRGREIIDEYARLGFRSIFLRPISPYGFAIRSKLTARYSADEWLRFYVDSLAYVLELNRRGVPFREEFTTIVLRKMLSPYGTSYVDLQSPAGVGISAVVYNYDGAIYASDEARMLAEMGDKRFQLGHLDSDTYADVFTSNALLEPLAESVLESVPMCSDCAFQPHCGADPVYHWATQGDLIGHKAKSGFCRRNMGVFKHLVRLLEDDAAAAGVLRTWV
jgi:His-Xaa-Ser system radical SAM maturase HxsB